jgi:hypothetical protein
VRSALPDGPCWSGLQQKLVERTKQQQQHREMNIAVRSQPDQPTADPAQHCPRTRMPAWGASRKKTTRRHAAVQQTTGHLADNMPVLGRPHLRQD